MLFVLNIRTWVNFLFFTVWSEWCGYTSSHVEMFYKKVFWKIWRNWQEKICVGVSLIKAATLLKGDLNANKGIRTMSINVAL